MLGHSQPLRKVLLILAAALALACGANMAAAQSVPLLVQAEAMTLTAPMAPGYDIAAMGGRFISATSGSSTENPLRSAHVQVNVPAGTYYLWARIAGPTGTSDALYVGIDSSFDRVFPSALGPYQWVRVETSNGSGAHGFALGGTHTLQVGYGEIGAKLDAVYLTASATEVPAFAPPAQLLIEAEALNRVSPMTVGSEPAALGGQYLSPTSGATSTTPVREASIPVHMPAGTWYLWARIAGPTMTSDALYVGIDTTFDRVFPSAQGPYQWVRVETADGSGVHGFALAAGARVIQVGHGEIGAKLDAVYLTNDSAEVPAFAPMRRTIEAESFTLQSPMTVGTDAGASGGQYVSPTSGTTSESPVREAWTTLTLPSSGTYYLWARLWGATDASDALYVGFNSAWQRVFPAALGSYEWVRVEEATLSAGEHVIQVGHGEIGARLDAVYVTDSATDTPTGGSTPPPPPPSGACALPSGGYQGFGRNTTGGSGQTLYRVTNLNNSGPGSLRDALSTGNRCIVFDGLTNGGEIDMTNASSLNVRSNVTIDGFTAPSPGITLVNNKPTGADEGAEPPILNISQVNNVVVRGIRIRSSPGDAIRVVDNAFNVVVDHVSVTGFGDGAIDVTQGAKDVTIQWSILGHGRPGHNFISLLALGAYRLSVHHNLYIDGQDRQPKCGGVNNATPTPEVTCDVRNNVIWDYTQRGTFVGDFGTGNVVNNYYRNTSTASPANAIDLDRGGRAFASGNHRHNVGTFSVSGSEPQPYPAVVPPNITDAVTAARDVRAGAGARSPSFPLDATDQAFINRVTIP